MRNGIILDAGVLQGLAKERPPITSLSDRLRKEATRLVTISEVIAECIDVPLMVLQKLHILIEPTRIPPASSGLLDAFSAGARSVRWSIAALPRADRAVVGHAIAGRYDIMTTDGTMKDRSFREFLRRLERLPDARLPLWSIPEIIVVRRELMH
jgi:hypothetical protein